MLTNINYKGHTKENLDGFSFSIRPCQCVLRYPEYTIILFMNGNCRIMGCKKPLDTTTLPLNIVVERIQSVSVTIDLKQSINLYSLSKSVPCTYEPEILPALRLSNFNPLCVNVFHTGKVVITGLKTLQYDKIVKNVVDNILLFVYFVLFLSSIHLFACKNLNYF